MSGGAVVVGAGQAGFQAAWSLRQAGYDRPVTLVGDEPHAPYGRPALSKERLAPGGAHQPLRPAAFYATHRIDLVLGDAATGVDAAAGRLRLASGRELGYDELILATGATARELEVPGADLEGVVALRTAGDAERLAGRLDVGGKLVVVGGGFVGLEVAAAARARGIHVRVVEAQDRLLARALSRPMSAHLARLHARAGVDVLCDAVVDRFVDDGTGAVRGVSLSGRATLDADTVVVGVGVLPNVRLAEEAGLAVADGILVDAELRTADPAIWAIGDCARFPRPDGSLVRIESVQNATDQARTVAAGITGARGRYEAVPWFWSVQHGTRLQIAGLATGHDRAVVRGDGDRVSVLCFRGERLVAVESVGRPKDHLAARRLLGGAVVVTAEQAADPAFELRDLL